MVFTSIVRAICFCLIFASFNASAALVGRLPITPGGTDYQAAYDTVLDITWVTHSTLTVETIWDNQIAYVDNLNTSTYLGFSGWRLASMSVAAGLPTGQVSTVIDCSTASELACRDNELGYMFYHNMGGNLHDRKTGNQWVDGVYLPNVGYNYWSGTKYDSSYVWYFDFNGGHQNPILADGNAADVWVVRDGDVGAVPIQATVWLFGSGLLGLIGITRAKKT